MAVGRVVRRPGARAALGTVQRKSRRAEAREPQINDYASVFERVHNLYSKEEAQRVAKLKPRDFIGRFVNPTQHDANAQTGRQRLERLRRTLDSYGLERSDMQKQFHNDMIGACAGLIFGDDLEAELDDLLIELGTSELHNEFMAITPRRFGKTYSVAMFVVAMANSVEGLEQAIFSTGRRASQKLLELVYRLMCKVPGMKESIVKYNVETLWVQGPGGPDDVRKIFSYPSNVKISLPPPIHPLALCFASMRASSARAALFASGACVRPRAHKPRATMSAGQRQPLRMDFGELEGESAEDAARIARAVLAKRGGAFVEGHIETEGEAAAEKRRDARDAEAARQRADAEAEEK